jgi:excisionase family DNA binding protein
VTVKEAQRLLGIGRSLAYQMIRDGRIASVRAGRRILVPVAVIERFLAVSDSVDHIASIQ